MASDHTIDNYRNIIDIAESFMNSTHRSLGRRSPCPPNTTVACSTVLRIATPLPPVHEQLIKTGLSPPAADLVWRKYQEKCDEIKYAMEESMSSRTLNATKYTFSDPEKLHRVIEAVYSRTVNEWARQVVQYAQTCMNSHARHKVCEPHVAKQERNQFNQDYVPFLEKYFEYNAYPSAADRALMAKKSMMTSRQIEVWFQNHRRRARLDGKPLKKLHPSDLPKIALASLEKEMPQYIIPESERLNVDSDISEYEWQYDSDEEDMSAFKSVYTRQQGVCDLLNPKAAPHAFPTTFSSSRTYDTYLTSGGNYTFPPPVWMRQPATYPIQHQDNDFDDFVASFSRLNVRGGPRKHWRKKVPQDPTKPTKPKRISTPPPKPDRSAATLFITTKVLSAPHPAFVRPSLPMISRVCAPAPVSNSTSIPPRCFVRSTDLSTLSREIDARKYSAKPSSGGRKVAPLPKRVPQGTSLPHRGAISVVMMSPSPSPSSRSYSSGSASSSYTRMSSASSSSSAVTTPILSQVALPEQCDIVSPSCSASLDGFHFPSYDSLGDKYGAIPLSITEESRSVVVHG